MKVKFLLILSLLTLGVGGVNAEDVDIYEYISSQFRPESGKTYLLQESASGINSSGEVGFPSGHSYSGWFIGMGAEQAGFSQDAAACCMQFIRHDVNSYEAYRIKFTANNTYFMISGGWKVTTTATEGEAASWRFGQRTGTNVPDGLYVLVQGDNKKCLGTDIANGDVKANGIYSDKQMFNNGDNMLVTFKILEVATLKCAAGDVATFCAPFDVTLPDGITAYSAAVNDEKTAVVLTATGSQTVTAGTPVIIKNTTEEAIDQLVYGVSTVAESTCTSGPLTGILAGAGKEVPANSYVLNLDEGVMKFCKLSAAADGVLYRCYLTVPSSARALTFSFGDGEPTAIDNIPSSAAPAQTVVYDLQGRRSAATAKGIKIVNGKKVIR